MVILSLARLNMRMYVGKGLLGQWKFWRRDKMPVTKLLRRHRWVRVISYIRRHCSLTKIPDGSKFYTSYKNKATRWYQTAFVTFFLFHFYIKEFVTDAISLPYLKHVSCVVNFIIYFVQWIAMIIFFQYAFIIHGRIRVRNINKVYNAFYLKIEFFTA